MTDQSRAGRVVHMFDQSLAASHAKAAASWWERVYREAFPNFAAMVYVRQDGWAQRAGIDRVITLASGRTVTTDEKIRDHDYHDVLLERWSDKDRRVPGWVQKPLGCDFIAYAIEPAAVCYLLPTLTMQRAWRRCGRDWIARYPECLAQNRGYVTASVAVPYDVLFDAMTGAMTVRWQ